MRFMDTGRSPEEVVDFYRAEKDAIVQDIMNGGALQDMLLARAGDVPFLAEEPSVMLEMSADLLAGKTIGKSRWEVLAEQPRQYDEGEARTVGCMAVRLGMIRDSVAPPGLMNVPNSDKVVIAEGGANRTSIVRREHGLEVLNADERTWMYQLGSGRLIGPVSADGRPNPEYDIALSLAPSLRRMGEGEFSEYELNLATALAEGWRIDERATTGIYEQSAGMLDEAYALAKDDAPGIVSIQPKPEAHGRASLRTGIAAVHQLQQLSGKSVAIATSSQYAPGAELRTALELQRLGVVDAKVYSAGDVARKTTAVYALEIATLLRQFAKLD